MRPNCLPGGVRVGGAARRRPGRHCRAWASRYLAESACAGMCVNLCKAPVQQFFTQELGMPLTMCARTRPTLWAVCPCGLLTACLHRTAASRPS